MCVEYTEISNCALNIIKCYTYNQKIRGEFYTNLISVWMYVFEFISFAQHLPKLHHLRHTRIFKTECYDTMMILNQTIYHTDLSNI